MIDKAHFSERDCPSRIYHCGFKIDHKIYSFGGMGTSSILLDKLQELDYKEKTATEAIIDKGKNLLEGL